MRGRKSVAEQYQPWRKKSGGGEDGRRSGEGAEIPEEAERIYGRAVDEEMWVVGLISDREVEDMTSGTDVLEDC